MDRRRPRTGHLKSVATVPSGPYAPSGPDPGVLDDALPHDPRVAARDPAIRLAVNAAGRLEVHEGDKRIAWFALDARGELYAFGAHDDEGGSISGPRSFVQDGIHHPT